MGLLRKLSLKQKLQAIIMMTVAAALLLASAALLTNEIVRLRESMDGNLRLLAEIINHESTHGRCTQTFIKKVRKQARPRPA